MKTGIGSFQSSRSMILLFILKHLPLASGLLNRMLLFSELLMFFCRKNVKQKKVKSKEKKPYTPFPPPQLPSKVDIQLETGEYFLSEQKKQANKWREKQEKQAEKVAENKRKRDAAFIPPEEPIRQNAGKLKNNENLAVITTSLKQKAKEFGKQKPVENVNVEDYVAASEELRQKKKSKRT
uniref:KRR1 small subunit processome component KRR-R motif-containing protein 1 n=1 Tax=Rhizophora mucronata TaxID=61149 RepID=A0A2P2KP20_RHIMU